MAQTNGMHGAEKGPERVPWKPATADLQGFVHSRLEAGTKDLYAETLALMERYLITSVLQETGGNQSKAAEILGITRGKIRDRIAQFGISVDKSVSVDAAQR
jgi:two-component system nitrogen regulation response regulator GlnG